jgi:hypothetical protein
MKILIGEGNDDLSAISSICQARIKNFFKDGKYAVETRLSGSETPTGGKSNIDIKSIKRTSKIETLTHLAFIVDADSSFDDAEKKCKSIMSALRADTLYDAKRFSYWIMPTQKDNGMLEDFILSLLDEQSSLLQFSEKSAYQAKREHNAPFNDLHSSKAKLRTWLAWQDEPGMRIGHAVKGKIIDPYHVNTTQFLQWFCDFFELELRS